jgi:hypothetical protein
MYGYEAGGQKIPKMFNENILSSHGQNNNKEVSLNFRVIIIYIRIYGRQTAVFIIS